MDEQRGESKEEEVMGEGISESEMEELVPQVKEVRRSMQDQRSVAVTAGNSTQLSSQVLQC